MDRVGQTSGAGAFERFPEAVPEERCHGAVAARPRTTLRRLHCSTADCAGAAGRPPGPCTRGARAIGG